MTAIAFAPKTTSSAASTEVPSTLEVTVQVMPDGTASCLVPYVSIGVPQNDEEVNEIRWTIENQYFPGIDVIFDSPGITFFGETPNVIWTAPTLHSRTAYWSNDATRRQHSYFYQIRLLRRTPKANGGYDYAPVTVNDPVIHNDPPSDTGL